MAVNVSTRPRQEADFRCVGLAGPRSAVSEARELTLPARSIGDRAGSLPAELSIDWKTRLEEMEMTYYTGIDVSLRSVSICVVDDKGKVCLEAKVAAEIDAIVDRLRRFSSDVRSVGFEAGTLTQYLTYGLQAAGFEVICLEARQVSLTLAAMRNKTDRNDAHGLAQIL